MVFLQSLGAHVGSVLEGSGPQKGLQKVGEAYNKRLAKDGLERRSGTWFSGKVDLLGHIWGQNAKNWAPGVRNSESPHPTINLVFIIVLN